MDDLLRAYYYDPSTVESVPHGSDTFYSDAGRAGRSTGYDATYLTARAGTGTTDVDLDSYTVGQLESAGVYYCYEMFLAFDTSAIPSGATVSSATLSLYPTDSTTTNAYTMRARVHPYGPTLTAADFVAGASLSGLTEVANLASASFTAGAYRAFSDVALAANVTKAGWTYLLVSSSLMEAATAPGAAEDERLQADEVTNLPKLEVVW